MIQLRKLRDQVRRESRKQNGESKKQVFVMWASRHRRACILASVLVLPACIFAVAWTEHDRSVAVIAALSALLTLVCGVLTIAIVQVIEQLKAIRSELVMIRTQVDTERLDDMADDLTALRSRMDKGLLGLLRI